MARRVVVRIIGVAGTNRGLAFAVTESPSRLIRWGLRRMPATKADMQTTLKRIVQESRVLFVAFDTERTARQRRRGRTLGMAAKKVASDAGTMFLSVCSKDVVGGSSRVSPTKRDIMKAVLERFPHLKPQFPPLRKPWQSEDERTGLFMALAAAVAAWDDLRRGR